MDCISVVSTVHQSNISQRFLFGLLDLVAERVVQELQVHQSLSLNVTMSLSKLFRSSFPSLPVSSSIIQYHSVSSSIHLKFCILKAALQLLLKSQPWTHLDTMLRVLCCRALLGCWPSPGQGPARATDMITTAVSFSERDLLYLRGSGRLHLT